MRNQIPVLGLLGVILLVFGLLGSLLVSRVLVLLHLILGLSLICWWLLAGGISYVRLLPAREKLRQHLGSACFTTIIGAFLICINILAYRFDQRWDLTEQGVHSLSDQTISLLRGLKEPLTLTVVDISEGEEQRRIVELLELYKFYNRKQVRVAHVDPRKNPLKVSKTLELKPGNMLHMAYGSSNPHISRLDAVEEALITKTLKKLVRGERKSVYYIQGHDEPDLESAGTDGFKYLVDTLSEEMIELKGLLLASQLTLPNDAAAIMLASPRRALLERERQLLINYVKKGGRLLLLHDPLTTTDIPEIAKVFNIDVGNDVILDELQRVQGEAELGWQVIAKDYSELHPITRGLQALSERATVFLVASSVSVQTKATERESYQELVKTSLTAWAETDLADLFGEKQLAQLDPRKDRTGPLSIAAAYQQLPGYLSDSEEDERSLGRLVVFGDSEWVRNVNLGLLSNRELFLNTVEWLVGQEEYVFTRRATYRPSLAPVQYREFIYILNISFIFPEALLILGIIVWWRRRHRVLE